VMSAGGRVLAVTGVGPTLQEAVKLAYAGVSEITFGGGPGGEGEEGHQFRTDIAHQAL
jgi:phosphoribosylamine--glycine ligase/phosphoribosylformylglycinamidine cyclo-ligase